MPTNPPQQAVMYAGEAPSWGLMPPHPPALHRTWEPTGVCINLNPIFAGLVEGPADTVGLLLLGTNHWTLNVWQWWWLQADLSSDTGGHRLNTDLL